LGSRADLFGATVLNRQFTTRGTDDEPPTDLLTADGKRKLEEELDRLAVQRLGCSNASKRSAKLVRSVTPPNRNSDRIDLSFVEGRIQTIELQLRTAQIIPEEHDHGVVGLGSSVEVEDEDGERDAYTIVGTRVGGPVARQDFQ
jgi:transcription elongation GreA/GreB family factor